IFQTRVLDLAPGFISQMRASAAEDPRLETELVAHGDGSFYKRHVDTQTGHYPDVKRIRVLSCVYYFNAKPKAFTGGALRLYALGGQEVKFVDIEPVYNSLVTFLAWIPHEVMPISCPSRRFIDSRFAVNCWAHGNKPGASP